MTPSEHWVRERAYYIWEGEGRVCGRAEAHWIQAEIELSTLRTGAVEATAIAEAAVEAPAKPRAKAKAESATKGAKTTTAKSTTVKTDKAAAAKTASPKAAAPRSRRSAKVETGGLALH